MRPDRRTVLAAGALTAIAATAKAAGAKRALTLFDPAEPAARTFARTRSGQAFAIQGDRVRLARRLFTQGAPDRLIIVGRHADVLLLSEAAREAGYRGLALDPFPTVGGGLFLWTAERSA